MLFNDYAETIVDAAPGYAAEKDALGDGRRSAPPVGNLTEVFRRFSAGGETNQKIIKQMMDLHPASAEQKANPEDHPAMLAAFMLDLRERANPSVENPPDSLIDQIKQAFCWFSSFTQYRRERIDNWDKFIGGSKDRFAMPAIIDFEFSLHHKGAPRVPIWQQAELMAELSRRQPTNRLVHGYIAFNPLRYIKDRKSATDTVEKAINSQGFIGVKLYPPMGFQASGNADPKVQDALNWVYDFCASNDAAILVHTAPSNTPQGNPYDDAGDWSLRANPKYWQDVLAKKDWRNLRVLLGHFGGAYHVGNAADRTRWGFADNHEWADTVVALMRGFPNVYADFSDYDLVLDYSQGERRRMRDLRNYLCILDGACSAAGVATEGPKRDLLRKRLLFGTDWAFMDLFLHNENYTRNMLGFLQQTLDGSIDDYAAKNALRFIGLDNEKSGTSMRLMKFHEKNPTSLELLGRFMKLAQESTRVASAQ